MNKLPKNRFKLNFKNQFFIKLLLTIVLIYSNSKKVDGLCSRLFERIVTNEISINISSNLMTSKIIKVRNSLKIKACLTTPASALTIGGTPTFTLGKITTGANKVIFTSTGSVSGTGGGYEVEKLQKL